MKQAFNIILCHTAQFGRGKRRGGGFGGSTEDMVEQYLFLFQCFMVNMDVGVQKFVLVVMMVEGMLQVHLVFVRC
jgi:hypothetical protein